MAWKILCGTTVVFFAVITVVPGFEISTDMRELLVYLGEKVFGGFMCLWCNDKDIYRHWLITERGYDAKSAEMEVDSSYQKLVAKKIDEVKQTKRKAYKQRHERAILGAGHQVEEDDNMNNETEGNSEEYDDNVENGMEGNSGEHDDDVEDGMEGNSGTEELVEESTENLEEVTLDFLNDSQDQSVMFEGENTLLIDPLNQSQELHYENVTNFGKARLRNTHSQDDMGEANDY